MGNHLYVLEKKGIMLVHPDGQRRAAYFLRLAVRNAFSQDSQSLVDRAIRAASETWKRAQALPDLVIQVGFDGIPAPGSPVFRWDFAHRAYCFESELPQPTGYLGEREIGGFLLRSIEEQKFYDRIRAFGAADTRQGNAHFDIHTRGRTCYDSNHSGNILNRRLLKILSLIQFIESKGKKASEADLQYLGFLREKASQLGS